MASRLPKLLQAVQQGTVIVDERTTTGNYLDRWLGHKQSRLRPRTFTAYQLAVELHLVPGIGKIPLARLTRSTSRQWFQAHHAAGASGAHDPGCARVLRAALNQALRWNLVGRNVAALVEPPRHVPREIQPLLPEQARALLRHVDGPAGGSVPRSAPYRGHVAVGPGRGSEDDHGDAWAIPRSA